MVVYMELQGKMLDKDYLALQVANLTPKDMKCEITQSDRALSRTLYITFYTQSDFGYWYKQSQVRVSDHTIKTNAIQLIVYADKPMTPKMRKNFKVIVEKAIKRARFNSLVHKLSELS